MPTKIFVGNVHRKTKPEQLQALFEKYGKVIKCNIIKNYAFVHMEDENEANEAICQLDGYTIRNSCIRLELSQEKSEKVDNKKRGTPTKLFVGNVSHKTKPAELRALFEKYGKVTECDIIYNFAFVHMEDENEANEAIAELHGRSINKMRIRVEKSDPKKNEEEQKTSVQKSGKSTTKIFVGNISPKTRSEDLKALFEQYGIVTKCDIVNKYAFVHMEYASEANQAVRQLHNHLLHGVKIHVELSHGKKNEYATEKKLVNKSSGSTQPLGIQGLVDRFFSGSFWKSLSDGNWSSRGGGGSWSGGGSSGGGGGNWSSGEGGGNWSSGGGGGGGGSWSGGGGGSAGNWSSGGGGDNWSSGGGGGKWSSGGGGGKWSSGGGGGNWSSGEGGNWSGSDDGGNWSGGGGGGFDQRPPFKNNYSDYYERDSQMPALNERYPPRSGSMSDKMGRSPRDRMRTSSPSERRPPMPPHTLRDSNYMDRDSYRRERSPVSRKTSDYDRIQNRDYLSPYQNNDNIGGFKRDAPMGRDIGMRSMDMDNSMRDQVSPARGGMDTMRRDMGGGGYDDYGQGDSMNPMMRDRSGTSGMNINNNSGYNNYNGQQSSGGGGYNMNSSYSNYNSNRSRSGMDSYYRDSYLQ